MYWGSVRVYSGLVLYYLESCEKRAEGRCKHVSEWEREKDFCIHKKSFSLKFYREGATTTTTKADCEKIIAKVDDDQCD